MNKFEVPEDLGKMIESGVAAAAFVEGEKARTGSRRHARFLAPSLAAVAAAVALALALVLAPGRLRDTYDDPMLAYAEIEKAFSYISSQVDRGMDMVAEAGPVIENTGDVLRTINKR